MFPLTKSLVPAHYRQVTDDSELSETGSLHFYN